MTASNRPLTDETNHPTAGERARKQLLDAAGEVFAERGYSQATSKEICERAGMNSASVNYHFGGFEALYAETLVHAHSHLVEIEALREIAAGATSPKEKLRAYLSMMLRRLAAPQTSWEMRLLSREIISPSPAHDAFVTSEILPKLAVLRGIIGALIGAAPDDPVVGRCIVTVGSPCIMMAITNRNMLNNILPGLVDRPEEIAPLIDQFELFIYAGLEAVAAQLRATRPVRPHTHSGTA